MITRIKNTKHRNLEVAIMFASIVAGLLLLLTTNSRAARVYKTEAPDTEQTDSTKTDTTGVDKVFTAVEVPAEFPGGLDGWRKYLEANLKYPKKAQKRQTQGVVKIRLTVLNDGTVSDIQVLSDPGDGLAEEAVRIFEKSPKWIPATQKGKKVKYRFVQTVTFMLQ